MHKRITFRHMDHSDVLETHVNEQLKKIEKMLEHERSPIHLDLILEPSKVREHHRFEFLLKTPNYDLVTHREVTGQEFYQTVDEVIDLMYQELRKHKEKRDELLKHVGRHDEFKKER